MSSPKMTRMLGFLLGWRLADTFWLCAASAAIAAVLPGLAQQSAPGCVVAPAAGSAAGACSALKSESNWPLAPAQPPTAPTASATRTGKFDFRNTLHLLGR